MNIEIIPLSYVTCHDSEFNGKPLSLNALIPLYGGIYCGTPNSIDEYCEAVLEIPQNMIGKGNFFALRAKGDSMIGAGINDGDIVIIKTQNYAENGQIVVARIDQDVTLKKYYLLPNERKILLHPENDEYDDIITERCNIMGIAVKILKNIEGE